MKPSITIYDCETGETVEREMTNLEFFQYEKDQKTSEDIAVQIELQKNTKASAQTKLAALGLTEDEVRAIIGA